MILAAESNPSTDLSYVSTSRGCPSKTSEKEKKSEISVRLNDGRIDSWIY